MKAVCTECASVHVHIGVRLYVYMDLRIRVFVQTTQVCVRVHVYVLVPVMVPGFVFEELHEGVQILQGILNRSAGHAPPAVTLYLSGCWG